MSVEAISRDLEEDEFRVRALQAAAYSSASSDIKPYSPLLDTSSSLSAIESVPVVPQFRPELPAPVKSEPQKHFMIGVLQTHHETERLVALNTKLFETEVKAEMAEIDRLTAEKQEALYRSAKESETRNTWGVLSTVAQYIGSASSVVLGIACVASGVGTAPGALLIASGGLGLVNQAMHDTRGWETVASWFTQSEELQTKIAHRIEMGSFFLSLGLGLAGGVWAYQAGAFAAAADAGRKAFMGKVGQAVALGSGFMGAGSRLGGAVVEKRIAYLQAQIRELETQMTTGHQNVYQTSADAEKMIDTVQMIGDEVAKAINATQISFD